MSFLDRFKRTTLSPDERAFRSDMSRIAQADAPLRDVLPAARPEPLEINGTKVNLYEARQEASPTFAIVDKRPARTLGSHVSWKEGDVSFQVGNPSGLAVDYDPDGPLQVTATRYGGEGKQGEIGSAQIGADGIKDAAGIFADDPSIYTERVAPMVQGLRAAIPGREAQVASSVERSAQMMAENTARYEASKQAGKPQVEPISAESPKLDNDLGKSYDISF